jgi:hypothetical protein
LTGIAALKPAHTREAHHLANPREPRPGPSTKACQSGEVVTGLRALPLERITRSVTSVDDHRFATGFDGYVATQILAIRRLVDDRNADVIPIRGLVKDISRNFALFTRENFVCFDGLPYDYDAVRRREMVQRIDFQSKFFAGHVIPLCCQVGRVWKLRARLDQTDGAHYRRLSTTKFPIAPAAIRTAVPRKTARMPTWPPMKPPPIGPSTCPAYCADTE